MGVSSIHSRPVNFCRGLEPARKSVETAVKKRRSLDGLIRTLLDLAESSNRLFFALTGPFEVLNEIYRIPRFLFIGLRGGGDYLRIGIFAGIHGDEMEGTLAIVRFLEELSGQPELARGYELFVYPICNPTGVEDGTRWSRAGKDLNREFWSGSREPEVVLLEEQLKSLQFNGLISLHSDDTSSGIYGFVRGASLTRYVLEPALQAAEKVLPRNGNGNVDNFRAKNGVIEHGYAGVLSAPLTSRPRPFEIIFETPQNAPLEKQVEATVLALKSILEEYRKLISVAQNI